MMETMISQLDLFAKPSYNLSIEKSLFSTFLPTSSLDGNSPIDFAISGTSDYYLDLSQTHLQVKVKVVAASGANLTTESVTPANNFLHSLFSMVQLQVQDKTINDGANLYPYKSYLETMLNYGQDAKSSQLSSQMFFKESNTAPSALATDDTFKKRQTLIANSKSLEMIGHLHLDLFRTERYMLNDVTIRIRLQRSKPEFCLITADMTTDCKIIFESAVLFVKKVKISPGVQLAHAAVMEKGVNARYPFTSTGIKYFSVASGLTDISRDNLFLGLFPSKIVICLSSTTAFNGSSTSNPFEFKHYDLCHLALVSDSETYPSKPFTPNYTLEHYTREYQSIFTTLNLHQRNKGNWLSYNEYKTGNVFYAIDLSADVWRTTPALETSKQGNLRLEMKFSKPLPENVTCLVYFEHDNMLEIDKNRHVLVETVI